MNFNINLPIFGTKNFIRTLSFVLFISIPLQANQCIDSAFIGDTISFGTNSDLTTPSNIIPTNNIKPTNYTLNPTCIVNTNPTDCNKSANIPFTSFMKTQTVTTPTIDQSFRNPSTSTLNSRNDENITSNTDYNDAQIRANVTLTTSQNPLKINNLLIDDTNSSLFITADRSYDLEIQTANLGLNTFLTLYNATYFKTKTFNQNGNTNVTLLNVNKIDAGTWNFLGNGGCSKVAGTNADYKFEHLGGSKQDSSIILGGANNLYAGDVAANNIYMNVDNISVKNDITLDHNGSMSIDTNVAQEANVTVGGTVDLKYGTQVCLAPGDYYFNNLKLGSGVHIDPIGGGTVRIFINGTYSDESSGVGSYINQGGDPSQLLIYAKNDMQINAKSDISGLVISEGSITMGSTDSNIHGAIIVGNTLDLKTSNHVVYDGYVNNLDSNDSNFSCSTSANYTKGNYSISGRCDFATTKQACTLPVISSTPAGTAPNGHFNVVMNNQKTNITNNNNDPLSNDDSPYNAIPTQISDKNISLSIVSLNDDYTTPKAFQGLVALELIPEPDYTAFDTEAGKKIKCENATAYYPATGETPLTYSFSSQSFSSGEFSHPNAYKNATFRVRYLTTTSGSTPVEWNCVKNTDSCIWGMLKSTYHNNIPCEDVCKSGGGTGANQKSDACIECVFGPSSTVTDVSCARDNFAIRPEKFELSPSKELLKSGADYNLSFKALQYDKNSTALDYNVSSSAYTITTTKYDDDNITINNSLHGTAVLGSVPFDVVDGNATADFTFDDVGKVRVSIEDRTWAQVDIDSGDNSAECNNTEDADGKVGAYICGDYNATFIPDHFALTNVHLKNFNNETYTYLANDLNISAGISATVTAQNADNNTTYNFDSSSWENPVDINFTLPTITVDGTTLIENKNDINETLELGFTQGVATINSTDTNTSRNLIFNFNRETNTTVNPFQIQGRDVNVTASSVYSATAQGPVTGTSMADENATFVYGRTHAPRYRFTGPDGNASIYYEIYCSGGSCDKNLLPNGPDVNSTDDPRWFINSSHSSSSGTIWNVKQKGKSDINATDITTGSDTKSVQSLHYKYEESKGYPYKATMENNASDWLIYNKYKPNAKTNEFEVEFVKSGDWTGEHETNTTTDKHAKAITNRRSMW